MSRRIVAEAGKPVFLAGGLKPDNVAEAVEIACDRARGKPLEQMIKEVVEALAAQERRALARPSYQPLEMAETPTTATRAPIHATGAGRAP